MGKIKKTPLVLTLLGRPFDSFYELCVILPLNFSAHVKRREISHALKNEIYGLDHSA